MNSIALPYPVLGRSDDYLGVEFQVGLKPPTLVKNDTDETILIKYIFDMSDPSILEQVNHGTAGYGFEIICEATSTRFVKILDNSGEFFLNPHLLYGRVNLVPRIFVLHDIEDFYSPNFNPEFGESKFKISAGDYLAQAEDEVIYVDFGRLSFESLLNVHLMESKEPYTYEFGLDGNSIIIAMGKECFNLWNVLRFKDEAKSFLIMSIYKDCIVAALEYMNDDEESLELDWARSLSDMLEAKSLQIPENGSFGAINDVAQLLLQDQGIKRLSL